MRGIMPTYVGFKKQKKQKNAYFQTSPWELNNRTATIRPYDYAKDFGHGSHYPLGVLDHCSVATQGLIADDRSQRHGEGYIRLHPETTMDAPCNE